MPTLSKSSSIVKTPGAQSVKEAIEINETNIDAVISHYNTNAVESDDTDISSASFVLDEDDMASDSDTKLATQQSIAAFIATYVSSSHSVVYATRLDSAATGDVDYTGFGFQPSMVICIFGVNDTKYFGVSVTDGTTTRHAADARSGVAGTYQLGTEFVKVTDGTNSQVGAFDSFISDGVRVSFTKSGTPTFGTIGITLIGFR